jgi:hypothetical protein
VEEQVQVHLLQEPKELIQLFQLLHLQVVEAVVDIKYQKARRVDL